MEGGQPYEGCPHHAAMAINVARVVIEKSHIITTEFE
jgi:hypothetical protein